MASIAHWDGRPTLMSRVHCPLSTDGETVDRIFSYIAFIRR
jgi:hypothetical protein